MARSTVSNSARIIAIFYRRTLSFSPEPGLITLGAEGIEPPTPCL